MRTDNEIITQIQLAEEACNRCYAANGKCPYEDCAMNSVKQKGNELGEQLANTLLGSTESRLIDAFWVGYSVGSMTGLGQVDKETEEARRKGEILGAALSLSMIYRTIAIKIDRASVIDDMSKEDVNKLGQPRTTRDYYYEARGIMNALWNVSQSRRIVAGETPEEFVEKFWNHPITKEELDAVTLQFYDRLDKASKKKTE